MKLHLPVRLFRAVVYLMAAAPAALYAKYTAPTEIVVPSTYTNTVKLSGSADISAQTESTVFRLTDDVTISPSSASFSGVSYLYTSDSAAELASISMTEPSGSTTVGLSVSSQLIFDSLKDIGFSAFTSTGQFGGAAMVTGSGSLNFSNNEGINFSSNSVISTRMNAGNGGGICVEGTTSFRNNGEILFKGNTAQSQGGAIALDRKRSATEDTHLVFDGNDTVTFAGNKTNNQLAGLGGALFNILGNMELNHNGDVTFSSNTARATYMAQGGAIYSTANGASGLTVELSYNDSLSFENNLAQSGNYNATDGNVHGGAILASGTDLILNSNGSLTFTGNKAYTTKTNWVAQGGAIRIGYDSALSIQNNGTVIFENNQVQVGNSAKYNSIYADDSSVLYNGTIQKYELNVKISAPEAGYMEFRDCVYIDVSQHEDSSFILNSKYTGEDGKEIAQTGDIIFTGSYMTSGDKTSEFKGTATLYDGKLIVKDGAVLKAGNLVVAESASAESTPTLELSSATLSADTLSFASDTALILNNVDNSTDAMISISTSLTMSDSIVLGLSNSYTGDTLKIAVANYTGSAASWLTLQTTTSFTADSLLWNVSNLDWQEENGTLYVTGTTQKKEVLDISNSDMVLDSENALGSDIPVVSTGTTTLNTADNVTVVLPGTIQNGGDLTISGSYDGSELEVIAVDDTRVCVDGKEGNNGFFREGGTALVVVDNKGNATLTVDGETTVTTKNNEELKLYASGLAAGELNYGNYHLEDAGHEASMSEIQAMRPDSAAELTITLNDGKLIVDENAENIQAKGGDIIVEASGSEAVAIGGSLEGDVSLQVVDGTAEISGEHSYTGATTISGDNSKLIVKSDKALGQSDVLLANGAVLDLGGKKLSNAITVEGCTIMGAANYAGDLTAVKDCNLEVIGDATANKITLQDNGKITGENILASAYEVAAKATGSITANVATRNGGTITLSDGSILTVNGTLTLGEGTTFVLNGDYTSGATLATADAVEGQTTGSVTLNGSYGTYTTNQGVVVLSAVFNQNYADALTVSNWGIATASRAMVNAVRGQRSNTGCIADGKGTAWVAILGGNNDINGSDISLSGAALGADMKVGEASRVGVAMGYVEGEVQPSGLRQVDQEGSYIAAYGEHGLKKLSSTSCLSMDWVAAYGVTDSEGAGQKWEQDSVQLNSRVNWNKKVNDKLCMSVFGGLEYFANNSDTVDGVKTGSIQNLRGEIGVGARYVAWGTPAVTDGKSGLVLAKGCEKLVLNGEIRYMNDMVRSNPVIRMEGLSGMGENPGRQGMGIEAGATYRIGERWSASANYGFNTMEDSKEHRVNVGAAYTF